MKADLPRAPLSFSSVYELLERNAEKYSDKEAIISYDVDSGEKIQLNYLQLFNIVQKTSSYLVSLGLRKGDSFAILMHNNPEILIFELAGAHIGAATVPLDYKRDLLERKIYKLKETGAKAIFIKEAEGESGDEEGLKRKLPNLKIVKWRSFEEFKSRIGEIGKIEKMRGDLDSIYIILYTSGTTAHPKGAILTQRACFLNASGIAKWQEFTDKERFMVVMPLHHINSTIFCLSTLISGGTIILVSRYSSSKFWEIAAKYGVTNTSIVPTILHDQLGKTNEFEKWKKDLKNFKRLCIGSAPVLPAETLKFYMTYGIRPVQGYGQTETALRVAGVPVTLAESEYIKGLKTNTIGKELANNHLAIMDGENKEAQEGQEGEICIYGPVLAEGYLNDKEATKRSFVDGWFHSGDLGKYKIINGEKYFYIIGRIKEIIIKGGVNISPSAIEDVLLKNFPEIEEVAVVGIPDARMGEEVASIIVLKPIFNFPASPAVRQFSIFKKIKEKILDKQIEGLSDYEMPKRVFFISQLPKTSTGKIQRVIVKRIAANFITSDISSGLLVRRIDSNEADNIKNAYEIEKSRFGLNIKWEDFEKRASNGILLGIFDKHLELIGSISCLRMNLMDVKKIKSWNEATGKGTLSNNNPNGDTLLCVAISVRNLEFRSKNLELKSNNIRLKELSKQYISEYVSKDIDHVLNFHKKAKGGIAGAKVWKIMPQGRPEDTEAMGYNVLMKYPDLKAETKIEFTDGASPSILFIESALYEAQKRGIKHVIAFSRPSGFREYLFSK
ncbi:hypothetical protein A2773_03385 [Candidatus Gottesmanbacteria bacterium RIFCSPHIGHO2_01_FULL_39_10]|uniref:AMP-dependent synthetase/ligase domain-containing protein n=1 Tax=Candidatus Gottesmanbacteria bacterium RIFCSPHIGHO2_01_FULL_39_10 TaxID=1798375 RepID=A0A1F5ZP86_9BACT|nr:MAG: hypothetical protein A2773_03385 [Candidatus Gottesmanbacteria bacterium RIFCSPHIGHO2_01_FULL_39_10]